MTLPSEVAVRRIVGAFVTSDGLPLSGVMEFRPTVLEVVARPSKVSISMLTRRIDVVAGVLTIDLIAGDDPDVDAGVAAPWPYVVTRSWNPAPLRIVVPRGTTGIAAADSTVDITTLYSPPYGGTP